MELHDCAPEQKLQRLLDDLDATSGEMAQAATFAKPARLARVLDVARRVMLTEGGLAAVEARSAALEHAGVFEGTDWAQPQILVPALTVSSLKSADPTIVVIEALNELRLLAVALGAYEHPQISAEQAHHYLTQVLALNLAMLFTPPTEAERETQGRLARLPRDLLGHLARSIGFEHILDKLIEEIWRILRQRPVQVDAVKQMVTQIAVCLAATDTTAVKPASGSSSPPDANPMPTGEGQAPGLFNDHVAQGADRLVSSLYGPTQLSREDPGLEIYAQRLQTLDNQGLQAEALGFARAMHDTGLVSAYHAQFVRLVSERSPHLLVDALGLSGTGRDCLACYHELVLALIDKAVTGHTPQAVFGLTLMLERGILYQPAVAPALWRQLRLNLSAWTQERLTALFGDQVSPRARLLEGVLLILGLPLGVGQGNNPTCQAARAISIWSYSDPDYLLQLIASAARDDEIVMHFEGQPISSRPLRAQTYRNFPVDLDPVSIVLVPHLDYIYGEMGKLCVGRVGDPHRWINPEFHGWWVNRGFRINVDVATGNLVDVQQFLRYFYAFYHPYYNDNQPVIHPQPAGIAITDSAARFIGWHAITIQRVALDPDNVMRVYFYNPNNDSGQDWGDTIAVSTSGKGELFGESSLPFQQFASRIYIYHYDPLEPGAPARVPQPDIDAIMAYMERSWGRGRQIIVTDDPQ